MSRPRVPYHLAGLLGVVGTALLLSAAGAFWDLSVTVATLSLTDVLVGVLGLAVSALTALAGGLIVADVRADIAAARAWQTSLPR